MQINHTSQETHAPTSKTRSSAKRVLGTVLAAAIVVLAIVSFTAFTTIQHPGLAPSAAKIARDSSAKKICSLSDDNSTQGRRAWAATLDWSTQGQIAATYDNLKVFSAQNCSVILSPSTQAITARWSHDGSKLLTIDTRYNGDILADKGQSLAHFSASAVDSESIGHPTWTSDNKIEFLSIDSATITDSIKSVDATNPGQPTALLKFGLKASPMPSTSSLAPDGKLVAVELVNVVKTQTGATATGISGIEIWNVENGKKVSTISTQSPSAYAWSPDGSLLALAGGEKSDTVKIYDTASGNLLASFQDPDFSAKDVDITLAWSPDGNFLAEGSSAIHIWDVKAQKIASSFGKVDDTHRISALAWSPDSKGLASATNQIPAGDHAQNTLDVWTLS